MVLSLWICKLKLTNDFASLDQCWRNVKNFLEVILNKHLDSSVSTLFPAQLPSLGLKVDWTVT